MRRRDVLKRVGAATTITLTAFAGTSAASSSADEYTHFVTDQDGQRVVVPLEDVEQEDVSISGYCADNCSPHCCSDCADDCDEKCGGCVCADPGC